MIAQLLFLATSLFTPKDYSNLAQTTGWNADLVSMHVTLYEGYVKNSNSLYEQIQELSKEGKGKSEQYGALKRRFGWEFNGMRLHELYFDSLTTTRTEISPSLLNQLKKDFGSFRCWKKDFIDTGLMRGIGWVILMQDSVSGKLCNTWINEHDVGLLSLGKIILVMDVFEHAYITQFGLDREKYINLFLQSVNWEVINERWAPLSRGPHNNSTSLP